MRLDGDVNKRRPKRLFPLIKQLNDDQEPVEIASQAGTAHLVSADQ